MGDYKFYSEEEGIEPHPAVMFHGQNEVLEMLATGKSLKSTLDVLVQKVESQIDNIRGSIFTLDKSGKSFFRSIFKRR